MIRYRLDDLGWYQFEWLMQSLLKAVCGIGVESWGGHGDYGRDAYTKGRLNFPSKCSNRGPFIFQAKFVENANAAGANSDQALLRAVAKEVKRIGERRHLSQWRKPRYYTLITNAPLSSPVRENIESLLAEALPGTEVVSLGGSDICDLLDQHENLRRSFPQLLSLRDLDELIHKAVSKETLERSRSAVGKAREIIPVFVPTSAHSDTWETLHKHNFAVLEGPPEMGKTAIAWIIALSLHTQGWQAITCDKSEDFFELYESETKQVFVADDAFGRTEYDPARCVSWERDLDHVLYRLNPTHWLIWTSRKHILERALRTMDLQDRAEHFPSPASVLVDAGRLSMQEKALILYRHSRAAGFEKEAKDIIRGHARLIIENDNFTPERIRRFIKEVLPELITSKRTGALSDQEITAEIRKAIQTPTERMRKSFNALPQSHKTLLVCLLEVGYSSSSIETLQSLYRDHGRAIPDQVPFEHVIEELSESFIKWN